MVQSIQLHLRNDKQQVVERFIFDMEIPSVKRKRTDDGDGDEQPFDREALIRHFKRALTKLKLFCSGISESPWGESAGACADQQSLIDQP